MLQRRPSANASRMVAWDSGLAMPAHLHTCMLCEAVCGLTVEVEGDSAARVRGDPDAPFSRGHSCPKAAAILDVQADPDRIVAPPPRAAGRRQAGPWKATPDEPGARPRRVHR